MLTFAKRGFASEKEGLCLQDKSAASHKRPVLQEPPSVASHSRFRFPTLERAVDHWQRRPRRGDAKVAVHTAADNLSALRRLSLGVTPVADRPRGSLSLRRHAQRTERREGLAPLQPRVNYASEFGRNVAVSLLTFLIRSAPGREKHT